SIWVSSRAVHGAVGCFRPVRASGCGQDASRRRRTHTRGRRRTRRARDRRRAEAELPRSSSRPAARRDRRGSSPSRRERCGPGPTTTTTTRPAGPTAVASIDRPGLYIVDVDGSKLRRVSTEAVFRPVWSPDGRHFAYFTSAGFRVTDMNGASHQVDGTLANGRTSVVWSPDSTRLAFPGPGDGTDGTPSRDIWVVNADGSQPARPIRAPGDDAVVD